MHSSGGQPWLKQALSLVGNMGNVCARRGTCGAPCDQCGVCARINLNPTFEWLEKALGHSFHVHLRVYHDMYSKPEDLVPFCLSQSDIFREHAERQFGAHLTIP